MTFQDIKEKLIDQISMTTGEKAEDISSDMMMHDIGMDSLGLVELFVFIEKEFNIQLMESGIPQEDIMQVDSLARSIERIINQ